MRKIIFNEHQQRFLEANPNVASVSERAIQYTPEFKIHAVKEYQTGKDPAQIFSENFKDDVEFKQAIEVRGAKFVTLAEFEEMNRKGLVVSKIWERFQVNRSRIMPYLNPLNPEGGPL